MWLKYAILAVFQILKLRVLFLFFKIERQTEAHCDKEHGTVGPDCPIITKPPEWPIFIVKTPCKPIDMAVDCLFIICESFNCTGVVTIAFYIKRCQKYAVTWNTS